MNRARRTHVPQSQKYIHLYVNNCIILNRIGNGMIRVKLFVVKILK